MDVRNPWKSEGGIAQTPIDNGLPRAASLCIGPVGPLEQRDPMGLDG